MQAISTLAAVLSGALGTMLSGFTILNAVSDIGNPFGSFGTKFIYEMDQVMGGQLGIPHYSKIEALLLVLGASGAWASLFTDQELLPVLGWTSASSYMAICSIYAVVTKQQPAAFMTCGAISTWLAYYRFNYHLSSESDAATASKFMVACGVSTILAGALMKINDTEDRQAFNRRFRRISKYCDDNTDFEWKPGKDAPEGFND